MCDVFERDFVDGQDLVVNAKSAIVFGSACRNPVMGKTVSNTHTSFDDLGDVDIGISWYMFVANSTCNGETETLGALVEIDPLSAGSVLESSDVSRSVGR